MKNSPFFPSRSRLFAVASAALAFTAPLGTAAVETFNTHTPTPIPWTCPGGVTSIQVEVWGGGGAGGAGTKEVNTATGTSQNGGGGGGGAYARRVAVPVTPGQTYTINIPAAAISGTNGLGFPGRVNGSPVTFVGDGGVTVTAAGGNGGANAYTTTNTTIEVTGATGGTIGASEGDVGAVFAGGSGSASNTGGTSVSGSGGGGAGDANPGNAGTITASTTTPGTGGLVGGGNGGAGRTGGNSNEGPGSPGATPGGGGGGGKNQGLGTQLGGAGGLGQIKITYTDPPPNFKDDNEDALNLATSWTEYVPYGLIAEWNNIVTGANTVTLGGDLTFAGIKISDPGGAVSISAGNTLTLGSAAIDLDLSAATQDLTLNSNLELSAANVWDVATTRMLTLGGSVSGAQSVTKEGLGTATLSGLSATPANNYSGTTTIGRGALVFTANDPSLSGGLTFGTPAGSTNTGSLDLTNTSATFAGAALVRTNNVTANTISIGATRSLSLNGGLSLGYDAGGGTGATNSNLTVSGAGSLAINGAAINVSVNQAGNNAAYWSEATLDVSGLAAFSTDVTNFNIGVGSTTQGPGNVLLSNTANTILATTLRVGDTGTNNGRGTSTLTLGTGTNIIRADTITIGRTKNTGPGVVKFASQDPGSPGTVTIANKEGTGRANIDIANQSTVSTGGGPIGTLDLRGHVATVSAGTVSIGSVASGGNTGGPNGTLSFDGGTFDVNTLTMGTKSGNSAGTAVATVNIGGGTFTVNTGLTMGSQSGNGASDATVNLTGGTLSSSVGIVKGAGNTTATINVSGGTLDLNGNAIGSGSAAIILNAESGTLKDVATINGTGGLNKTTAGTLIVEGTDPYSGNTTVTEGTLTLSDAAGSENANTINDASSVNIAATGATLDLAYTGTDVVNELYIGGVLQAPGVWGAVGSGAPKQDSRITGNGTLTVTTGSSGFATWITGTFANGTVPGGEQGPNDDPDNDGITNLVEYALAGQDPTVANPAVGTYDGSSLSFDKRQPLAADITYAIQQSTDLGLGDTWEEVSGGTYTNNSTIISYSFTPGTPVKDFFRLSVSQNP